MELMGITTQLAAVIIQGLGGMLLVILVGAAKVIYSSIKRVHTRLDHLDVCLDDVKKKVEGIGKEQQDVRRELSKRNEEHGDLREQLAHLKGASGMALHEEVHP